jgi:rfaE bifunctional protein kinase chain/domain
MSRERTRREQARSERLDRRRLERVLGRVAGLRLLVVGDVVLDEYLWGEVDRVSPEAPVPVVHVRRESVVLGGAGNVVRNAVALGARCAFCAIVGDDADGRQVLDLVKEQGVDPGGVIRVEGRVTTRKTRVVARSQQVVRFDRETREPLSAGLARRLVGSVASSLDGIDGAVLADYGKGLFTRPLAARMVSRLALAGVPAILDPKLELAGFRGVELVKPNWREAEALSGLRARDEDELARVAARLSRRLGGARVAVTRGAQGMCVYEGDGTLVSVPTAAREVFDVQGAGDTIVAVLALARRAGASLLEAAVLANAAASVVVGKIGTATATREEVLERLPEAVAAAEGGT